MSNLTITIKDAADISGLPATFIRKQVDNKVIPNSYSIKNDKRKTYIIYRDPFMKWLEMIKGNTHEQIFK